MKKEREVKKMKIRDKLSDIIFISIVPLSFLVLFIEKRDMPLSKGSVISLVINSVNWKGSSFVVEFFLLLLMLMVYVFVLYGVMYLFIDGNKVDVFSSLALSFAFSHLLVSFLPKVNEGNIFYIYFLLISFLWGVGCYFFSKTKNLKNSIYVICGSLVFNGLFLFV